MKHIKVLTHVNKVHSFKLINHVVKFGDNSGKTTRILSVVLFKRAFTLILSDDKL